MHQTCSPIYLFLDTHVSLAPTHVCLSVGPLVRRSHFRISNLSASLVALREKLKRDDPNYFFQFWVWVFLTQFFLTQKLFWHQKFFWQKFSEFPKNFSDFSKKFQKFPKKFLDIQNFLDIFGKNFENFFGCPKKNFWYPKFFWISKKFMEIFGIFWKILQIFEYFSKFLHD